jgi:putative (di)nucleoside polyphosphate hydrolase
MAVSQLDLPYRPCVGIMLIDRRGLVWVGRRRPKWADDGSAHIWQMPQGGICAGESARAAALRELEEETGVVSVELLAEAPGWFTYDLPDELLGIALKGRYRGQRQKWFAMRFTGTEREIDISPRRGHKAEFNDWRWTPVSELPRLIVPFKRQVYRDVVREFRPLLRPTAPAL